jgi:hypothetical protein
MRVTDSGADPTWVPAAEIAAADVAWSGYGRTLADIERRSRDLASASRRLTGSFAEQSRGIARGGREVDSAGSAWERMRGLIRGAAEAFDRDAVRAAMSAAQAVDRSAERMQSALLRSFRQVARASRSLFDGIGADASAAADIRVQQQSGGGFNPAALIQLLLGGGGGGGGGGFQIPTLPNILLPQGPGGGSGGGFDIFGLLSSGLKQVLPALGGFGQSLGKLIPGLDALLGVVNFANRPTLGNGLSAAGGLLSGGAALGLLPATLGPVGAIIGAIGMVVSLFSGNKKKNPGAGVSIDFGASGFETGKVTSKHMDPGPMVDFVRAATDALNKSAQAIGGTFKMDAMKEVFAMGVGNGGKISVHGYGPVVEHENAEDAVSDLIFRALRNIPIDGISATMATVLKNSKASDLKGLLEDIDFAELYQSLGSMPKVIGPFEQQLRQLDEQFRQMGDRATGLGLALEPVIAAHASERQRLRDRFNGEINDRFLQRVDPAGLALRQLSEEFVLLRQEAVALGGDLIRLQQLEALERQRIVQSAVDRILDAERQKQREQLQIQIDGHRKQLATEQQRQSQLERLIPNLKRAFDRLLIDPNLSPLSHEARLGEARSQFDDLAARAAAGDLDAAEELEQAGRALLEASRGYNASNEAYGRDFQRVRDVLANTRTIAEQQLDQAKQQTRLLEDLILRLEGTLRPTTMAPPPRPAADAYLAANPDVAASVASGLFRDAQHHYDAFGRAEGRPWGATQPITVQTTDDFNSRQQRYLDANPDVARAVAAGQFTNAYHHFQQFGRGELRAFASGGFLPAGEIGIAGETGRPELIFGPAYVANPEVTRRVMDTSADTGADDAITHRLDRLIAVAVDGDRRLVRGLGDLTALIADLKASSQRLAARS